jgi:proteasome accessory factor C
VSDQYLKRLRRLLLLLPVAARAAQRGRGVPLEEAVRLTGARSAAELAKDVEEVAGLWTDPVGGQEAIDLYVENGEVHVTYELEFGTPPAFSLTEGALLLAALQPFEQDGGKPVRQLVAKLRKAIPEPLRPEADRLARGLDLAAAPPEPWAGSLQDAIDRRLETLLEYRAVGDGEVSKRVVEPRVMFQRDGQWYLAAWNVAKAAEHLYRLDRIVSVEVGLRRFGEHKGPPVARYVRRNLFFESGAEVEVTLRLTGLSAAVARERLGARGRDDGDGPVEVRTRVTPGPYLVGHVLGHGGEATVTRPKEAADLVAATARALLARYAGA